MRMQELAITLMVNETLGRLPIWKDERCVDCGRSPAETVLNIEGVIHHRCELRCLERKTCERIKKARGKS